MTVDDPIIQSSIDRLASFFSQHVSYVEDVEIKIETMPSTDKCKLTMKCLAFPRSTKNIIMDIVFSKFKIEKNACTGQI